MRIQKIENSNVLKTGQLLVVLKCWKFYGNAAVCHLQQSVRSGLLKSYRHRQEPVPWISRPRNYRLFRHPRTTNERRAHYSNEAAKEILEYLGVSFKLRRKRNANMLPTYWDDISRHYERSWKAYRKTQRKNAGGIDRRGEVREFLVKVGQMPNITSLASPSRSRGALPLFILGPWHALLSERASTGVIYLSDGILVFGNIARASKVSGEPLPPP